MGEKTQDGFTPKTYIMAAIALSAAGGLGSVLGLTIEPKSVTDMKIEHARLQQKVEVLEESVEACQQAVRHALKSLGE